MALVLPALAAQGDTELASVGVKGKPLDARAGLTSISADGRFVSFSLDTGQPDVWVYDSRRGKGELISGGRSDRSAAYDSSISADGRFVAFVSTSDQLVPGPTDGFGFTDNNPDVFVFDRKREQIEWISQDRGRGGRSNLSPVISANGRFVAFSSNSNNLIKADPRPKTFSVYVYDRKSERIERVSADGAENASEPAISADGRFVSYQASGKEVIAGPSAVRGASAYSHLKQRDVYVYDRDQEETELISAGVGGSRADGESPESAISADGRYVAFASHAENLVPGDANGAEDVFLRDREAETTELLSLTPANLPANGGSFNVAISADGAYVGFASLADNLVDSDTNDAADVFVGDLAAGSNHLISTGEGATFADGDSSEPVLSADGRFVAFASEAGNIVSPDGSKADVFLHDFLGE